MALIEQMLSASYPVVLADKKKGTNQWAESSALRAFEKLGMIKRLDFGATIEVPLDYRANPDAAVMASDQDAFTLLSTDILGAASYDVAQLSVPVTWSKAEEAKNPMQSQKVALVAQKLDNAINSHDDLIEQCIFTTSTAGGSVELLGLDSLVPTSGQGTVGGVSAVTETWWRNPTDTYTDASDIEAAMEGVFNQVLKGTGSTLGPKLLLSGRTPYGLYGAGLQTLQRFTDTKEADGGFTALAFKTAQYVFSQYGGNKVYFLNPQSLNLLVSRQYFRDKGDTQQVPGQNAFYFLIYSALQMVTNNKSRLGVIDAA
jgi:hypothetical protein